MIGISILENGFLFKQFIFYTYKSPILFANKILFRNKIVCIYSFHILYKCVKGEIRYKILSKKIIFSYYTTVKNEFDFISGRSDKKLG
jgi:hypothetical protein